jgi:hypothetical protein
MLMIVIVIIILIAVAIDAGKAITDVTIVVRTIVVVWVVHYVTVSPSFLITVTVGCCRCGCVSADVGVG